MSGIELLEPFPVAVWVLEQCERPTVSSAGYGTLTNEDAATMAKEWFALQRERLALREKYYGKMAKVTSNLIAARFVQVENAISMLIDLQVAAELPLLK